MSRRRTSLSLLSLIFLFCAGCDRTRTYDVKGRVVGFGNDPTTVIVEHEDIPGLMPAMTMPFTARDSSAVDSLRTGDALAFRLNVSGRSSWIDGLRRLPDDAVARHPAGAPDPTGPSGGSQLPLLEAGDHAPDIRFVSQADTTFRLSDLEGDAVVLSFIYTRCPLPDYCPLMSRNFTTLQSELSEKDVEDVHLVSVSFDPTYDLPEVLHEYGRRYTDDFSNWSFVTGDSTAIKRFAEQLGAFYEPMEGQIVHNLVTVLIGPDGRLRKFWRGNGWTPEDVLRAIDEMAAAG